MSKKGRRSLIVSLALLLAVGVTAPARSSELDDLRATVQAMQKSMEEMQKKIAHLEEENRQYKHQASVSRTAPAANTTVTTETSSSSGPPVPGTQVVTIAPTAVTIEGCPSEIRDRRAMDDQQEPAPRPKDLTLDPKYRGFVPIPNTPVLIKV